MTFAVDDSGVIILSSEPGEAGSLPAYDHVIDRLRSRAGRTEPWHIALLEAIGDWNLPHEEFSGQRWRYVIGGEALDWLTLAHRLCLSIPDAVPPDELDALLFYGRLPQDIGPERFREIIGPYRYTAHLNFWYGVVVEEALQLVTEDSIRKSRLARCYGDSDDVVEEAYRHLYGDTRTNLVPQFLDDAGGAWGFDPEALSLVAWQEFTYWLFKRRIRKWHPARVASDTRRGLQRLHELREDANSPGPDRLIVNDIELLALQATKQGR